ncbi:uncharacterized protein CHSO_3045 [Chryseobacterium sp. StRB126]|uniref:hypothetical protein n=1 Tax=Chryseobacterium sp. StRB126 TaxID=878220 RepID=UPI0004E98F56|nr:hypothetical protein [Chryseobacterium sp. StRB126]BAP32082.1 uncharacterized protein CHSO_3045 [Chryseobacterium sp. StRB126]
MKKIFFGIKYLVDNGDFFDQKNFLFLVTIVLVSYAEAQSMGGILLNGNCKNGTLESGLRE